MSTILAGERGLVLRTLDDYWRFSVCMFESGLAPKDFTKPQAVLIAVQLGAELGISPVAAMQNIAVINGRPTVWGDIQLAVVRASGRFDESVFEETLTGDLKGTMVATCVVRRLPHGKPIKRTFSIDDAKIAELWGKKGPWTTSPRRMLQLKARNWALRDAFGDLLKGVQATEEAMEYTTISVQSTPSTSAVAEASPLTSQLRSEAAKQNEALLNQHASEEPTSEGGEAVALSIEQVAFLDNFKAALLGAQTQTDVSSTVKFHLSQPGANEVRDHMQKLAEHRRAVLRGGA